MLRNDLIFLKSILESNVRRLSFPFKLAIAVTYRCNLKCKMCNIWKKEHRNDELKLNEIEQFFRKAKKFSWVGITGGEPFLREDLLSIVEVIISNCYQLSTLHFATNGQLTERIISLVKHIHKKYSKFRIVVTVSIDGPPSVHNDIRGVDGSWDNAVCTFKELKSIPSVKAQVNFTLSYHNTHSFKDAFASIKEVCPGIRLDDINITIFEKSGFYFDNEDLPEIDDSFISEEINRVLLMDKKDFHSTISLEGSICGFI